MASDPPRIGILGATGAVGSTILQVLAERGFEAAEVVPLASERSAGSKVTYGSDELEVRLLEEPAPGEEGLGRTAGRSSRSSRSVGRVG